MFFDGVKNMKKEVIAEYREARKDEGDHRLINTITLAADIIIKLATDFYTPEQTDSAWEIVELLIRHYAERRQKS